MGRIFRLDNLKGDPSILKQTILLKVALIELGLNPDSFDIGIDHDKGVSTVNGLKLGIVYPEHFFAIAKKHYHGMHKKTQFYFNGFEGSNQERKRLLEPYSSREGSEIIFSNEGRDLNQKGRVNPKYFEGMSTSHFGLCPHQPNWPGNLNSLWTYRFIECLMLKTAPVLLRATPLSKQFIQGFEFVYDDEIGPVPQNSYLSEVQLEQNFALACQKFTLPKHFIKTINETI